MKQAGAILTAAVSKSLTRILPLMSLFLICLSIPMRAQDQFNYSTASPVHRSSSSASPATDPSAQTSVELSIYPTGGAASPTPNIAALNLSETINYGDSISTCTLVKDLENCYVSRIKTYLNAQERIARAIAGAQVCDVGQLEVFPADSPAPAVTQPLRTLMIGTNDARSKGAGPYESTFNLCHQAVISWLGTRSDSKVFGSDVLAASTGTCAIDNTFKAVQGIRCTAAGSTASFTLTTDGGPVYVWYRILDDDTGAFTLSVDGTAPLALTTAPSTPIATQGGRTRSIALARVPVSAGTHTVNFAQTAPGTMAILAVGTPGSPASSPLPYVVVSDVPSELNGQKQADVDAYSADARANIDLLTADGLNLSYAPVSKDLAATTAAGDMGDPVHPNDVGHGELFTAFLYGINQLAPTFPWGQSITLTATVSSASGDAATDGSVTFYDGSNSIGTAILSGGAASITTSSLPAGSRNITASFAGTTSHARRVEIIPAPTATVLSASPSNPTYGQSVTLTASVTSGQAAATSGVVTFQNGGSPLGSASLDSNGAATFTTTSLPLGNNTLSAVFPANADYIASASAPVTVAVAPVPTATRLTATPPSPIYGTPVTITASVVPSIGQSVPSGTVNFYNSTSLLGSVNLAGGNAVLVVNTLPLGMDSITASFPANGVFSASASPAANVTVVPPPDFTIAAGPAALAVKAGQTAATILSISPENGFDQPLSFKCDGLPAGAVCNFGSPVVRPDGAITVALSIATGKISMAGTAGWPALPLLAVAALAGFLSRNLRTASSKRYRLSTLLALATLLACAGTVACGSHSAGVTSNITVTAATQAGLAHKTQITLDVE